MKKFILIVLVVIAIALGIYFWRFRIAYAPETTTPGAPGQKASVADLLAPTAAADVYNNSNKLVLNSGSAEIKNAAGTTETTTEAKVAAGDTITVKDNSSATLYWFDGSVSRLKAGTVLTVEKADYNPQNITETHVSANVVKGEVWSKVVNLVDQKSDFFTTSGSVVAGVRGSTYNFIVNTKAIKVESFDHTAFVGKRRKVNNAMVVDTSLFIPDGKSQDISSDDASSDKPLKPNLTDIPKDRLDSEDVKKDREADLKYEAELRQKNLDRLKEKAGALPGTPDYEAKNQALKDLLDAATDPAEKAKLQAEIATMRLNEAVVLASGQGGGSTLANMAYDDQGRVKSYDYTDSTGQTNTVNIGYDYDGTMKGYDLTGDVQKQLQLMDHTMEGVLPTDGKLYDLRQGLWDTTTGVEPDPAKKEHFEEKAAEHSLYDLKDALKQGADPTLFNDRMQQYQDRLQKMDQTGTRDANFNAVNSAFLDTINNPSSDPKTINDTQKRFFEKSAQDQTPPPDLTNPAPKPIVKPIPKPLAPKPAREKPAVIDKLAPFRKGPSNR